VKTLEDAKTHEIVLAASGAGSTPAFYARVLADVFNLKVKIVHGYKGQTDSFLAMEQGENDGNASPFWASLTSSYPHWLAEKKIRPLVYYGSLRNSDIPAPHALDLLKDSEKRAIIELAQAGLGMGRPIAAPPDVDDSKVGIFRKAMSDVFNDTAYQEECKKSGLDCAAPSSGSEMPSFVEQIYSSPRSAVEKISRIYMLGKN
jgi:hypothetical protein